MIVAKKNVNCLFLSRGLAIQFKIPLRTSGKKAALPTDIS